MFKLSSHCIHTAFITLTSASVEPANRGATLDVSPRYNCTSHHNLSAQINVFDLSLHQDVGEAMKPNITLANYLVRL